jgi:glutamate/tyrosine decarboxylase-like PLP-dependent enzyme
MARLVQDSSAAATAIADDLRREGFQILNEVVINQVLVRLDDAETTERLIAEIQRDGRIWCGATQWGGGTAMRISVSSWKTDLDHAKRACQVIVECRGRIG